MVWNQKIAFRIFLAVLIVVFAFIAYIVLFDSSETPIAERLFDAIGFKSAEDADTEAVPLPLVLFLEVVALVELKGLELLEVLLVLEAGILL